MSGSGILVDNNIALNMHQFLTALTHLDPITLVKTGGYLGVATIIFSESGLLLGIFLPGDSLLFTAGLLAAAGYMSYWPLVILSVFSAVIGDSVGYWFGAKVGDRLAKRPDSRFFKQTYLRRTEEFYERYGNRAIILARFVPIVRTLAPILAGVGSMRYARFFSYNVIGGIVWGAGMVSLGWSFGSVVPNSEQFILPIALIIIIISFLPVAAEYVRERKRHSL